MDDASDTSVFLSISSSFEDANARKRNPVITSREPNISLVLGLSHLLSTSENLEDRIVSASVVNPPEVSNYSAARYFAAENQYDPSDFGAFGAILFPERSTSSSYERHMNICEAFVVGFNTPTVTLERLQIPARRQIVTIWPIRDASISRELNEGFNSIEICESAIDNYDTIWANSLIELSGRSSYAETRGGPFLLAWAPGDISDLRSVQVLFIDLSDVETADQARDAFRIWRRQVELDSRVWSSGFSIERLRLRTNLVFDNIGSQIFGRFFGE